MKLIIQNGNVVGTATEAYFGPDAFIAAPEDFDMGQAADYQVVDGVLTQRVPRVITVRQAKLALLAAGLLDNVEAAVAQAERSVQIEWEYAQEFKRDWPALVVLAAALGLSDAALDDLFLAGARL